MAEDSDNALLSAGGPRSAPVYVNPAASMGRGMHIAGQAYDLREKQAQEAWGNILQQATDENGNVDYPKAQLLAKQAGPVVQMKMMESLKDTSGLRGQQIVQAGALHNLVGNMSASLANDPSDDNVAKIRASAVAAGLPAHALAEIDRIAALQPEQRRAEAYKHTVAQLDALHQLARTPYAQPTDVDVGGARVPVTTRAATPWSPASSTVQPGGVTVGPPPGSTVTPSVAVDNAGIIPLDANGNFARPTQGPVTYRPSIAPTTSVPGVATGGQQIGAPGGASTTPGAPPVPPPPGTVLKSGAYSPRSAATPAAVPGAAPAATPPPPATPAPSVPGATPLPPASKPPVFTSPPQQQPEKLAADVKAYTEDQAAVPAIATRSQNMGHAYEALKLLQSATGKGAAGINEIRSRLQTLGLLPQGAVNEQKLVEIFTKYTERAMIEAAGGASTDMGRRMSEQSNAGTLLSTPANIDILRNDMGKTLQTFAAYKDAPDQTGNGYLKHRADVADKTDPRGFVWELYTPEEQARINKEVEGNKVASDKLHKAMGMARRLNLQIPGVTGAPPPQRQSFVAPQAPAPNAFAMAQPPGNPLLAA